MGMAKPPHHNPHPLRLTHPSLCRQEEIRPAKTTTTQRPLPHFKPPPPPPRPLLRSLATLPPLLLTRRPQSLDKMVQDNCRANPEHHNHHPRLPSLFSQTSISSPFGCRRESAIQKTEDKSRYRSFRSRIRDDQTAHRER